MKGIYRICLILVLLSSIDLLLFAGMNLDLVDKFFPDVVTKSVDAAGVETVVTAMSMWTKTIYWLFGIAGVRVVAANMFGKKA